MTLTTPSRVRNRIQVSDSEISDAVLNEFIADDQAYIESFAGKSFSETDPQFSLARSVCTDLSAAKALIYLFAPSSAEPENPNLALARSLRANALDQLQLLKSVPQLRPRSSTWR